jgi:predicted oxidoreductase (fatty acid repression mutant protein)
MTQTFLDLEKQRRTIYALGQNVQLSDEAITELVTQAIKHAPTAFNSQTVRAVILLGDKQDKLWDITAERLRSEVPDEAAYQSTLEKMNMFKGAYGNVMFFTDTNVVKQLEQDFPLYADKFATYADHGQGIAQFATWLALTEAGLGANLQHYNPLIDELVAEEFDLPSHWQLVAQMNFGSIEAPADPNKEFIDDAQRIRVIK